MRHTELAHDWYNQAMRQCRSVRDLTQLANAIQKVLLGMSCSNMAVKDVCDVTRDLQREILGRPGFREDQTQAAHVAYNRGIPLCNGVRDFQQIAHAVQELACGLDHTNSAIREEYDALRGLRRQAQRA
jgi:hypothetical protein